MHFSNYARQWLFCKMTSNLRQSKGLQDLSKQFYSFLNYNSIYQSRTGKHIRTSTNFLNKKGLTPKNFNSKNFWIDFLIREQILKIISWVLSLKMNTIRALILVVTLIAITITAINAGNDPTHCFISVIREFYIVAVLLLNFLSYIFV